MDMGFRNCGSSSNSQREENTNINFKGCKKPTGDSHSTTLEQLVRKYWKEFEHCYADEDRWWGDPGLSWIEAQQRAWLSKRPNGKMHGHQCNVGERVLEEGLKAALAQKKQSEDFKNFEELHAWVRSITDVIHGLGAMTAYDVARRLGAWLGLQPSMVWLHRGTKDGAKALNIRGNKVPLNAFPEPIQRLGATHVENFLCIYKKELGDL